MRGAAAEDHHFSHVVSWFTFTKQTLDHIKQQN